MSDTSKQFLDSLKQYNKDTFSKDIFIPSLERTVRFGTLTAKHQKDIIRATIDNPLLNLIFHDKVYNIIKELCEEPMLVDTFTVYDKDAILIQFRYYFIDTKYKEKDFQHNLDAITQIKEDFEIKVSQIGDIAVQYQIPNLAQERKLYTEFKRVRKYKSSTDDEDDVRNMVTDVYVLELIKHISKIQLVSLDLVVDFNKHTFVENVEVIDSIGKRICDDVHEYINDLRESHKCMYAIDDNTMIEILPSLFS